MNRISRRSATEAADALLEVGRTQPVLHYDVELGLARHRHWLRNKAPVPDWAGAGVGATAKSGVPVVIKTIVSLALIGAVAAWQARGGPQPSAADVKPPPAATRTPAVAPSVGDVTTSEDWLAPRPIPIPDQGPSSDADEQEREREHADRTARGDLHGKRTTRSHRAHRARASAHAAGVRPASHARPADDAPAPAAPATPATTQPSEDERAIGHEVAAAQAPKRVSAARRAGPEPEPQAQVPDDLLEMQQVATAEQLLEGSPERALALVRQGDRRFTNGYFQQERAYIAIMALIRLGRVEEARARAARFAKHFPPLPFGARIRGALEGRQAATPGAALGDPSP